MPFTPIVGTLGYVLSADRRRVLMVRRNRRPEDAQRGKCNGLGGKLEPGEDIAACMKREVLEESGLVVTGMELRGTISWPGFGRDGEDWFGFVFVVTGWEGEPWRENADGPLEWVEVEKILDLPLWEGDQYFLPLVFGDGPTFHGVMPYRDGKPVSWRYTEG